MWRKLVLILGLVGLLLTGPKPASAHLFGQPPFFRINGVYSNLYPVPTTSIQDFPLPQDLAASNYLVGQQLQFVMETNLLPVPAEIVQKSKFEWDYGDGQKATGTTNTHTYTKMGSYLLSINVISPDTPQPQLIQSVLINILPSANYQLPQAVLKINGQGVKDPLTDVLKLPFAQPIQFDASQSKSSSPITSYFLDYGDGQSVDQAKSSHTYTPEVHQYFPMLRIKTADGFLADTFVEVESADNNPPTVAATPSATPTTYGSNIPVVLIIVPGLAILAAVGWLLFKKS